MGGQPTQVAYLSQFPSSLGAFHGGMVGPCQPILSHVANLTKVLSSLRQVRNANVTKKKVGE
jgi:hypothetical protein